MYYLAWSLPPLLALAGVCLYHDTYWSVVFQVFYATLKRWSITALVHQDVKQIEMWNTVYISVLNDVTWQYGGMQGYKASYCVRVAGYGGRGLEFSQLRIAYGSCRPDGWPWWIGVVNGFNFWCCDAATSHLIPEFWFRLPSCPFFHSCHLRWCQGFQIVGWSYLQKGAIWLSQEVRVV